MALAGGLAAAGRGAGARALHAHPGGGDAGHPLGAVELAPRGVALHRARRAPPGGCAALRAHPQLRRVLAGQRAHLHLGGRRGAAGEAGRHRPALPARARLAGAGAGAGAARGGGLAAAFAQRAQACLHGGTALVRAPHAPSLANRQRLTQVGGDMPLAPGAST